MSHHAPRLGVVKADQARTLAEELLANTLPRRWRHVEGVAHRALRVAEGLDIAPDVLVSAAWLHDIGYAPKLVDTGFHPLDGARFLRGHGVAELVVGLVAHHSCARLEAEERGLSDVLLEEFPPLPGLEADALCFCDMTTSPDGDPVAVDVRLAEIRVRYGAGHVVTRFIDRAEPEIKAVAERVTAMLGESYVSIDVREGAR